MTTAFALILIILTLVAAYLFSLSPHYRVTRSITIRCPATAAFDRVADLKSWSSWSPWLMHEPDCPIQFSGDPAAAGGGYQWDGKRIGAGKMTHIRLERPAAIEQSLEFIRPFRATTKVAWRFEEKEDGVTTVSWSIDGRMPFFFRPMAKKMDAQIGPDYELGLALLKAGLEEGANQLKITFGEVVECPPQTCLTAAAIGSLDEIKQAMTDTYPKLIAAAGDAFAAHPRTYYHRMKDGEFVIDMAVPVKAGTAAVEPFVIKEFAGGAHLTVTQQGAYDFLKHTWHSAMMHLRMIKKRFAYKRPPFEMYENDPHKTAADELVTVIHIPVS